jgi:hypothetical protein
VNNSLNRQRKQSGHFSGAHARRWRRDLKSRIDQSTDEKPADFNSLNPERNRIETARQFWEIGLDASLEEARDANVEQLADIRSARKDDENMCAKTPE